MRLAIKRGWNPPAIVLPVFLSQRSRNCASHETKWVRIKVNNLGQRWRTMSSGSEWFMCHFQLHSYNLPSGEPCLDNLKKTWNFPKQVYFTKSLHRFQAVKFARFIVFPDCFSSLALLFFSACISNSDSCLDLSEVVKSESLTDAVSVYSTFELRTGLVFFLFFPSLVSNYGILGQKLH